MVKAYGLSNTVKRRGVGDSASEHFVDNPSPLDHNVCARELRCAPI